MRATLLIVALAAAVASVPIPDQIVLSAPFTPFNKDLSLRLDEISKLAAHCKQFGVNTVWVGGGMGQFDTMSIAERKALQREWLVQGHAQGLYMIAHVGTTVQSDAIDLAQDAWQAGYDAIAAVPPYYETPKSWPDLIAWFRPVVDAAKGLPFFYYHIPGSTGVDMPIYDFLTAAQTTFPELVGIKYVEENWGDWVRCIQDFGQKVYMLWAPEPKLRALPFRPLRGVILAETFYAPTWRRMANLYKQGNSSGAQQEQAWKQSVENVFGKYSGDAKRAVYRQLAGMDMGPPRPFNHPIADSDVPQLVADLQALNFFNQTWPAGPW